MRELVATAPSEIVDSACTDPRVNISKEGGDVHRCQRRCYVADDLSASRQDQAVFQDVDRPIWCRRGQVSEHFGNLRTINRRKAAEHDVSPVQFLRLEFRLSNRP